MFVRLLKNILKSFDIEIRRAEKRRNTFVNRPAWEYQSAYVLPHYKDTDRVIDIGCGGAPSPLSSVLTDYFPDESIHRARPLVEDRPLVVCSADRMPFRDKFFDLSICSHVLEHVPDPIKAVTEIARISRKGYLETPAYGKDVLVGTGNQHIWQVVNNEGVLHFFPYTQRQHQAHADSPLMDIWCQEEFHPWQQFFWERQDIFNAIQFWGESPNIFVHEEQPDMAERSSVAWLPVAQDRLPALAPNLNDSEIALLEACLLAPDGCGSMRYVMGEFVDSTGAFHYPVRGKRVYFDLGVHPN